MESIRRRAVAYALAWAFGLLSFTQVSATVARGLGLEELSARSDLVVLGRIRTVTVNWSSSPAGYPVTIATVEVLETLRGPDRPPGTIQVLQIGGTLNGITLEFGGRPRLKEGEEAVLFLRRSPRGPFVIVGMAQGILHVIDSDEPGGPWLVRELRGMVLMGPGPGENATPLPGAGGRIRYEEIRKALGRDPSTLP